MTKYYYNRYRTTSDGFALVGLQSITDNTSSIGGYWGYYIAPMSGEFQFDGTTRTGSVDTGTVYRDAPYPISRWVRSTTFEPWVVTELQVQRKWKIGDYVDRITGTADQYPKNGRYFDGYWYVRGSKVNQAPSTPLISVPNTADGGARLSITWSSSSDPEGNLKGYQLQRSINGGTFSSLYDGEGRTYTDTINETWGSVQYRVRAYDTENATSGWSTSDYVTVITNTAPSILGVDTNHGAIREPFSITYKIFDADEGQSLTLVEKLNGRILRTVTNAVRNRDYTIEISKEDIAELAINQVNVIEITVTDSKNASSVRRDTFVRDNASPIVTMEMANLGEQNEPFSFKFTVDDADSDEVSVKLFIDDNQIADLGKVELGVEQNFQISKLDYIEIENGEHNVRVVATDAYKAEGFGVSKFTKNLLEAGYRFFGEDSETVMPTGILVSVLRELAEGAEVILRVCRNGDDEAPTWEEINVNEAGQSIYNFTTMTKTASTWKVGVDIKGIKGTATKDSYMYGAVGFYFLENGDTEAIGG